MTDFASSLTPYVARQYDLFQTSLELHAAGHDGGAGEPIEPEGQKCQRRRQVAEHRDPVIGRAVDDPIQGADRILPDCVSISSDTLYRFGHTSFARDSPL